MVAKAFVDTNVLLRAVNEPIALHQQALALIRQLWNSGTELWISRQVLREFLVQATHARTFAPPLTVVQAMEQLEEVTTLFHIADETQAVTDQLRLLLQKYQVRGKNVHDANIVATMLAYEIDTLLTMNLDDFKRYSAEIRLIGLNQTT